MYRIISKSVPPPALVVPVFVDASPWFSVAEGLSFAVEQPCGPTPKRFVPKQHTWATNAGFREGAL